MRKSKIIVLRVLSALLLALFVNGCYYVFHGQNISARKLSQGRDLNLYEKCSVYSMHLALWAVGWTMSPQAALAVNSCRIVKSWQDGDEYSCTLYSFMEYPVRSDTKITIGSIRIPLQEGLFRYLQDKGWLSRFTAVYNLDHLC